MSAVNIGFNTVWSAPPRFDGAGYAVLAESLGHADQRLLRATIATLAEQLARGFGPATGVILFGALAGDDR